jgi:hypothetical protein
MSEEFDYKKYCKKTDGFILRGVSREEIPYADPVSAISSLYHAFFGWDANQVYLGHIRSDKPLDEELHTAVMEMYDQTFKEEGLFVDEMESFMKYHFGHCCFRREKLTSIVAWEDMSVEETIRQGYLYKAECKMKEELPDGEKALLNKMDSLKDELWKIRGSLSKEGWAYLMFVEKNDKDDEDNQEECDEGCCE